MKTITIALGMLLCALLVNAQNTFILKYTTKQSGATTSPCSSMLTIKAYSGGISYSLKEQENGPEKTVVSGDVKLQSLKISSTSIRVTASGGESLLISANSTQHFSSVNGTSRSTKYFEPASADNLTAMADLMKALNNPGSLSGKAPAKTPTPAKTPEKSTANNSSANKPVQNSSNPTSRPNVVTSSSTPTNTGTLDLPDGKYVGELSYGVPQGKGTMTYKDGDRYEGQWASGVPHGKGKYTATNGDQYDGEWKAGLRHGYGVMKFHRGGKYEGNWKNDDYDGKGKMTFADGAYYEGDYMEGYQEGHGVYVTSEGKYVGSYKNGKRNGQGTYTGNDGTVLSGNWTNGILDRSQDGVFSHKDAPVINSKDKKRKKK